MLSNFYEIDRLAHELPKARLAEAENERRAHLARQAAAMRQAEAKCADAAANPRRVSVLSSRLFQLLRG